MTAHVIHNINRPDRLANIIKQADEQGFEFEIHAATMDEDNPVRGCHLSHRKIVQKAKDEGWPCVWIMEDDCMFTGPGAVKHFLRSIPMIYRIYTGGSYGTHKTYHKDVYYTYPQSISGTHCYILRNSVYGQFLGMDENEHLDVVISKTFALEDKVAIVMPAQIIALQMPGYSDITRQEVNYNNDKYLWQYELWKGDGV